MQKWSFEGSGCAGSGAGWTGGKREQDKKGHGDLGGGMACLLSLNSSAGEEPERGQGAETHIH